MLLTKKRGFIMITSIRFHRRRSSLKRINIMEEFKCECTGEIIRVHQDLIYHRCDRTSQSYGMETALTPYRRVQVDLKLTAGVIKYSWFVALG